MYRPFFVGHSVLLTKKALAHLPPFKPDQRLFPFESKRPDNRAGKVRYVEDGAGDSSLFMQGTPRWGFLSLGPDSA